MLTRKKWVAKLEAALNLMRGFGTAVAKATLDLIKTREVEVLPFSGMTKEDFIDLVEQMRQAGKRLKKDFPPTRLTMCGIQQRYGGLIYENRLYVNEGLDPLEMSKTILHEGNHFLNDSEGYYKTPEQQFKEELRAHIAEEMSSSHPITRSRVKKIAAEVADTYQWNLPEKVSFPDGEFFPIPKKLKF